MHDLGIVLSHGQTIRHEFPLRNPTARPVRVLGAQALMPCCSEVESPPETIPARGEARLAVAFRPGFQSGPKTVKFAVRTDEDEEPVREFALRAALVAEVQVATVEGEGLSLLGGKSGNQVLRIVGRRYRNQGAAAPATIANPGSATARFVGRTTERTRSDGVIESLRDVAVEIPPGRKAGSRTEALTFGWPDGRTWEHRLHWTVTPHLRAIPDGLVVRPDDAAKSVVIRSETAPFRVLGLDGARAEVGAEGAATSHVVRLDFDRGRPRPAGPFDVTIRTDHPDQPEVVVSVLMAPSSDGR